MARGNESGGAQVAQRSAADTATAAATTQATPSVAQGEEVRAQWWLEAFNVISMQWKR